MADYPKWSFNFEAAQKKAFEALKPYYEKILALSRGDLDLAKRMILSDYESGTRETKGEYEQRIREEALLGPQETEQLWTGLNRRGVADSASPVKPGGGLAGKEAGQLKERQSIRQEAIERAMREKTARLETSKSQGLEKQKLEEEKLTQETGRSHEREAADMAAQLMGVEQTKYQAGVNEWLTEQQRKATQAGNSAFSTNSGTWTGGGDPSVEWIKANYPGYRSWNDTGSILGDFRNTGGAGKG